VQNLKTNENAVVDVDVRDGIDRWSQYAALQQAALEYHIVNLSNRYDFVSIKAGRQPFNSDFRSLIFFDTNQGVRLFGSAGGNRYQWNVLGFYQAEKDTFSELNTFDLRNQTVAVANLFVQDFLFLGWQNELSFHADYDDGVQSGFTFAEDGTLVRPDPVGAARPHIVQAYYLGWASEGHIGPVNISHAVYEALGNDTLNPIAGRQVDINAQLAFLELSVDVDWMRYQASIFFTSGDDDPRDGHANGFDTIFDFPRIMGGDFSYWNRQGIRVADRGGVGLVQRNSVVPDLRSSKIQGQANFVNPGLLMANLGATAELTQTLRAIANVNYLRFINTEPLEILLKQPSIRNDIGLDVSLGIEYRPFLSNNIIVRGFGAILQPWGGFVDIYQPSTLVPGRHRHPARVLMTTRETSHTEARRHGDLSVPPCLGVKFLRQGVGAFALLACMFGFMPCAAADDVDAAPPRLRQTACRGRSRRAPAACRVMPGSSRCTSRRRS
jgi:hypothetical protein